jgi:hypothetical protein
MHIHSFIFAAIVGVAVWAIIELWTRWRASRIAARPLDQARHPERNASEPRVPMTPERRFVVRVSDAEVVCERPEGKVEGVAWVDLQKVEVVTTADGPFSPDVFWVLHGSDGGCVVPQGATGDSQLLERLQALPGFDNQAFIEAMSSTSDRRHLCWQKQHGNAV